MRYWLPRVLWALLALWFFDAVMLLGATILGMLQVIQGPPPTWLLEWAVWGFAVPIIPAVTIGFIYALRLLWKSLPRKETRA